MDDKAAESSSGVMDDKAAESLSVNLEGKNIKMNFMELKEVT